MKEEVEKKSLTSVVEKFNDEVNGYFEEKDKNALLVLSLESDISEGKDAVTSMVRGTRENLCVAICRLMESNEIFRNILLEGTAFYKFKNGGSIRELIDYVLSKN